MQTHLKSRLPRRAARVAHAVLCLLLPAFLGSDASARELDAEKLQALVQWRLRANPHYRPGDLICRTDVEPIFNDLLDGGLKASHGIEELYDSFLPESAPVVQILRTVPGRKFMRAVSSMPGAFDLLERLTWLSEGTLLLKELIASPDGPQLFQTLMEPENLKALEHRLADHPRGRNLRLPTGHIYTADQLVDHVKKKFSAPRGK